MVVLHENEKEINGVPAAPASRRYGSAPGAGTALHSISKMGASWPSWRSAAKVCGFRHEANNRPLAIKPRAPLESAASRQAHFPPPRHPRRPPS